MSSETLRHFLINSLLINYGILLLWFLIFTVAHDWMQRLHGRWFRLSQASFDAINYAGMAAYKIGILLFNLVPLIALWLMRSGS